MLSDKPANDLATRDTSVTSAVDRQLQLLSSANRRRLLSILQRTDQRRWPVALLADEIAAARPTDTEPQIVATMLHHSHLPKLDDAGVIDYGADQSIVIYRGDPLLEQCLQMIDTVGYNFVSDFGPPGGRTCSRDYSR